MSAVTARIEHEINVAHAGHSHHMVRWMVTGSQSNI